MQFLAAFSQRPFSEILTSNSSLFPDALPVATKAALSFLGTSGLTILSAAFVFSALGAMNGSIMTGARVPYAMAIDGLFFKKASTLNKNAVPEWALWAQCVVAALLCLSGKYGDLLDMVSFIVVIFYVLTIIGIFILRKKRPDIERPYKAVGYPVLPAIYVIMGTLFCVLLIIYKPNFTWPGLIIALLGIPLYYLAVRSNKK